MPGCRQLVVTGSACIVRWRPRVATGAACIVGPSLVIIGVISHRCLIIIGVISCIPWGRGLKAIGPGVLLSLALLDSRKAICTTALEPLLHVGGGMDSPLYLLFGKFGLERFLFRTEVRGEGELYTSS